MRFPRAPKGVASLERRVCRGKWNATHPQQSQAATPSRSPSVWGDSELLGLGEIISGARWIKRVGQLVRVLAFSRGAARFHKRGGEEEGFSGSAAWRRRAAFFLNVAKALREKKPSAAAHFVSPDLHRQLHITTNTTDGNLLLGQPSPSLRRRIATRTVFK